MKRNPWVIIKYFNYKTHMKCVRIFSVKDRVLKENSNAGFFGVHIFDDSA